MTLKAGDVSVQSRMMDHAKGVWAGSRPSWHTATHEATGFSVTWHELCDQVQWKQREIAMECIDMMVEAMGAHCPPLAIGRDEEGTP